MNNGSTWAFLLAGLGVAGLVPLAVLSVRVVTAARLLGRELERTRSCLAVKRDALGQNEKEIKVPRG
ncbi:hypothetical protein [Streptosporangium sp. KLBMP 9127]|nr:hypothetical protein [Streptosporangium sp. KLBMP 9127]